MDWPLIALLSLGMYTPFGLLLFAPASARLARRRNRDAETWLLLGGLGGPIALAWIALLPASPRPNDAELLESRRRRTPANRIPPGPALSDGRCLLCKQVLHPDHRCQPEAVEDRIQRRWTVRIGGQRIIGPP
jgi:hypothetical protein